MHLRLVAALACCPLLFACTPPESCRGQATNIEIKGPGLPGPLKDAKCATANTSSLRVEISTGTVGDLAIDGLTNNTLAAGAYDCGKGEVHVTLHDGPADINKYAGTSFAGGGNYPPPEASCTLTVGSPASSSTLTANFVGTLRRVKIDGSIELAEVKFDVTVPMSK